MHTVLETERLTLRTFAPADVDNLVELDSDPDVMHFLTGGVPTPREQIENVLLPRIFDEYTHPPGWGRWAAIEKATGTFLGWFSLDPPKHGNAEGLELGYRRYVRTFHLTRDDPIEGSEQGEVEYELRRADWEQQQDE
jgi:RimJ/RimL family protein N-acetyltransferase